MEHELEGVLRNSSIQNNSKLLFKALTLSVNLLYIFIIWEYAWEQGYSQVPTDGTEFIKQ